MGKKTLVEDMLDITIGTAVAGPAVQVLGASGLPAPIVGGTQALIGTKLLTSAADINLTRRK